MTTLSLYGNLFHTIFKIPRALWDGKGLHAMEQLIKLVIEAVRRIYGNSLKGQVRISIDFDSPKSGEAEVVISGQKEKCSFVINEANKCKTRPAF